MHRLQVAALLSIVAALPVVAQDQGPAPRAIVLPGTLGEREEATAIMDRLEAQAKTEYLGSIEWWLRT